MTGLFFPCVARYKPFTGSSSHVLLDISLSLVLQVNWYYVFECIHIQVSYVWILYEYTNICDLGLPWTINMDYIKERSCVMEKCKKSIIILIMWLNIRNGQLIYMDYMGNLYMDNIMDNKYG